jgi:hypothetical protein
MRGLVGISASLFLVLLVQSPARASVVTGTVTYFAVPEHGNHDFGNPSSAARAANTIPTR